MVNVFNKKAKKEDNINDDGKMNKKKFSEILEKEHVEHAMMIGLTAAIVIVFIFLAYSMYGYYKVTADTTLQIHSLNGSIHTLNDTKYQLISNNSNLTLEINSLNEDIEELEAQKASLTTEKNALTAEYADLLTEKNSLTTQLATLRTNWTSTYNSLKSTEADLADCEDASS